MFYNYYESEDFKYDACISKGLCSVDPMVTSLQEVIVMYLKQLAFYMLKLNNMGFSNNVIDDNIINTLSNLVSNTDYSQDQFKYIINLLYKDLIEAKALYESICKNQTITPEALKTDLKLYRKFNIVKAIQQGEKEYMRKSRIASSFKRQLYEIIFILIKTICIKLIELRSFEEVDNEAYKKVLNLLNLMNSNNVSEKILKQEIIDFSTINYSLINKINNLRVEFFGEMEETTISFSTRPNKAILVSGSILKELQKVLDATMDLNIDIYTHGAMILAHTYPKFKKYPQLIGHFGFGIENCLLDFSTFPGAILMTKNSLQNVEYLYRGRLFTTDFNAPKGVVAIENSDFYPLIQSALDAKGFSKGQSREPLTIGFLNSEIDTKINKIVQAYQNNNFKHLIIVTTFNQSIFQKKYFESFLKYIPKTAFSINLIDKVHSDNHFQISSYYDFLFMFKFFEKLNKLDFIKNIDVSVFLTKCDKHTLPNILSLNDLGVKNLFLANCTSTNLNPRIIDTFKKTFNIKNFTNPKKDLASII